MSDQLKEQAIGTNEPAPAKPKVGTGAKDAAKPAVAKIDETPTGAKDTAPTGAKDTAPTGAKDGTLGAKD